MVSCKCCRKKTNSLYMMECDFCTKKYCISCRTPESHNCEDFVNRDKEKERQDTLSKQMPKIEFDKLEKL